jgi:hypothetical protein
VAWTYRSLSRSLTLLLLAQAGTACVGPSTHVLQRYSTAGTYVAAPEGAEAIPVDLQFVDCAWTPVVAVGDACRLRGAWTIPPDLAIDDAGHKWHRGSVALSSGQSCGLATRHGPVTLRITNGNVKVDDDRTIHASLAGDLVTGSDVVGHATFELTATPAGGVQDTQCPAPPP